MRTPTLQYLYLQKPVTTIIILCMIAVVPWIILDDPAGNNLPPDAAVAESIIETGNWILPSTIDGVQSYQPPMVNWVVAAFSLPSGYVSGITSRLPSTLSFILISAMMLIFFGRRVTRFQEAFVGTLFFITACGIHRSAMIAQVDMLFALFMLSALFSMFRWEEQMELKGLPVIIPALLGCAALTKGPVGVLLPIIIFAVYLILLRKYRARTLLKAVLYIFIPSLFLPFLWYIAAWKQGQAAFMNILLASHSYGIYDSMAVGKTNLGINLLYLLVGFTPWTVYFIFSLCGFKLRHTGHTLKENCATAWQHLLGISKVRLFALVALVCTVIYFSIIPGGGSAALIPAYPFIALFVAKYILYLAENRTKVTRVFASFYALIAMIVSVLILMTMTGSITLSDSIGKLFEGSAHYRSTLQNLDTILLQPRFLVISLFVLILLTLGTVIYQLLKRNNIKIMYATVALTFTIYLFADGAVMHSLHQTFSQFEHFEQIEQEQISLPPIEDPEGLQEALDRIER